MRRGAIKERPQGMLATVRSSMGLGARRCPIGQGALSARCGEVSVTLEMLVADAEQGSRDRSLASQRDDWALLLDAVRREVAHHE